MRKAGLVEAQVYQAEWRSAMNMNHSIHPEKVRSKLFDFWNMTERAYELMRYVWYDLLREGKIKMQLASQERRAKHLCVA